MTLLVFLLAVAAAAWTGVSWLGGRWSAEKLRGMRDAFAFLHDFGMECVDQKDHGVGAIVEYRGAGLWLNLYEDRGTYSWQFGLVDRPEYRFDPREFSPTLADADQFMSQSVRDLGAVTRRHFKHFADAISSEQASEIVRRRKLKYASELQTLLGKG